MLYNPALHRTVSVGALHRLSRLACSLRGVAQAPPVSSTVMWSKKTSLIISSVVGITEEK